MSNDKTVIELKKDIKSLEKQLEELEKRYDAMACRWRVVNNEFRTEREAKLVEALKYIVDHSHLAENPKWGNEFVDVAKKALDDTG